MTTSTKDHRDWVALVKNFRIDLTPRNQRGFICNMLLNALHQMKSKGSLSSIAEKQIGGQLST